MILFLSHNCKKCDSFKTQLRAWATRFGVTDYLKGISVLYINDASDDMTDEEATLLGVADYYNVIDSPSLLKDGELTEGVDNVVEVLQKEIVT